MAQVTVCGTNLFKMAATYLSDASQWYRIAEINKLTDPMISGPLTLRLPDPITKSVAELVISRATGGG